MSMPESDVLAALPPEIRELLRAISAKDWSNYYDGPLPDPSDDDLQKLVQYFVVADPTRRLALRASLERKHVDLLGLFARRMAALAVREQSPQRLATGLNAIALFGDSRESDWRDLNLDLDTLRDASRRLTGEHRRLFLEAAELAGELTRGHLRSAGAPSSVLLRAIGFILSGLVGLLVRHIPNTRPVPMQTADGFRYVSSNPALVDKMKQLLNQDQARKDHDR